MNVNWPSALSVPTQVVVSLVAATVVTPRESALRWGHGSAPRFPGSD
jgi:hypothetical protein